MLWLGIDVGGTFTDFVLYDEAAGTLRHDKLPSTPEDPAAAMLAGIDRLEIEAEELARLVHGTTIATNTLLERNGARLSVLTTKGFRDVLVVGRGNRTKLYDIRARRPPPLLPRARIHEVAERTRADGSIDEAVDLAEIEALVPVLAAEGAEAVAVCFLHAHLNPENERRAAEALRQALPGVFVTTSAEVFPEIREVERFATTAVNAYVAPRVGRYLERLETALTARDVDKAPAVMTSNGGAWPLTRLAKLPVNSILSGPAAGVIGAAHLAATAGLGDLITLDMGGTSTDTCLVRDGAYEMSGGSDIGGLASRIRGIEINTVGAGGGSIAWQDVGGFLNVGPRSAGAHPGPACYGQGGEAATVTDANLLLGRLSAEAPLGGTIRLDHAAAAAAVGQIADDLGVALLQMADGIVKLAVARMTTAVKEISIMRGLDPRDFSLFAYGGAGPMHAAAVAAELAIARMVIPPLPGNFSALGLLAADVRYDHVTSRLAPLAELSLAELQAAFDEMCDRGREALAAEGVPAAAMRFQAALDLRYRGQAFELTVAMPEDATEIADVEAAFRRVYAARYGEAPDDPAELVCLRLSAVGALAKPEVAPATSGDLAAARLGGAEAAFDAEPREADLYDRGRLPPAAEFQGPALVLEAGATTVVPPDHRVRVDGFGNLIMEREG